MLKIEITNLTGEKIPPRRLLKKAAAKTLKSLKQSGCRINLVLMTDRRIKVMNRKFKKRNAPTDVLAFNTIQARRGGCLLGDIAVSVDAAAKNAKVYGTSKTKEILLYFIHGILHLFGYDDRTESAARRMRKKEDEILNSAWNS